MKFTIVSHACMYVEGDGGSILTDPWFLGTCYWRSWWNFPEPAPELIDSLKPSSIYITHLHWDHFHGPSLRRFKPDIRIFVPKLPTDRMVRDLNAMGYRNVVEIPHGGHCEIWPGCRLHSYQFGAFFSNSAAVISDGRTTIVDLNDCKLFGLPLRQLTSDFPGIDFVLRSHSSASPIPYCVEGYKERFPELRSQQNYIDEFINCGLSIGARYAIPFASNHCFVHRETVQYNDTVVNPAMIEAPYNARAAEMGVASKCVVMTPGSTWSERDGFSLKPFDYAKKDEYLAELLRRYSATLERQYAKEDRTRANFAAFEKYFSRLMSATPWVAAPTDADGSVQGRRERRAQVLPGRLSAQANLRGRRSRPPLTSPSTCTPWSSTTACASACSPPGRPPSGFASRCRRVTIWARSAVS